MLLSTDSGVTYPEVLASGAFNGEVLVSLPALESSTCRIKVICHDAVQNEGSDASDADFSIQGTVAVDDLPVHRLALAQNYPNPFNPSTEIRFELPREQRVQLRIYNVEGKLVRTLVDEQVAAGRHIVAWRGKNEQGGQVASGLYFYRLSTTGSELTRKMLLLK